MARGYARPTFYALRKTEGEVINHLGFMEGVEGLVIAARGDDGMGGMGIRQRRLPAIHMPRIIPIVFHGTLTAPVARQCAPERRRRQ